MTVLLLILLLFIPSQQSNWKPIKEMSGPIPEYPGLTIETYATEIRRDADIVKLILRLEMPQGAPYSLRDAVPRGFDVTSIVRVEGRIEMNCATLTVRPSSKSADVYRFDGRKYKSKELPFSIPSGHIFAQYFCEQGTKPTEAPKLKPK